MSESLHHHHHHHQQQHVREDNNNNKVALIEGACVAAQRNDLAALSQVLQCKPPRNSNNNISTNGTTTTTTTSPLNMPLLNSTKQAQIVHQHLFFNDDDDDIFSATTTSSVNTNTISLLRCLLMVPPIYETPWLAAYDMVCRIQQQQQQQQSRPRQQRRRRRRNNNNNIERDGGGGCGDNTTNNNNNNNLSNDDPTLLLRSCIAEIQCFIRQTVSGWWERERRWTTPTAAFNTTRTEARSSSSLLLSSSSSFPSKNNNNSNSNNSNNSTTTTKITTTTKNTCIKTPRDWVLKIIQKLIEPLRVVGSQQDDDEITNNNDGGTIKNEDLQDNICFWMIPLELVSTIVSVIDGFDHSFQSQILDVVFFFSPTTTIREPNRFLLLSYLNLAADLHPFLRFHDWENLLLSLQRCIIKARRRQQQQQQQQGEGVVMIETDDTTTSRGEDLPDLMREVVSISSKLLLCCGEGDKNEQDKARELFRAWVVGAALEIFYFSATKDDDDDDDPSTFSKVTAAFRDSISGLPSDTLPEWLSSVVGKSTAATTTATNSSILDDEGQDGVPDWVKTNVVLTLMRVSRKSGNFMLNKILSRALEDSGMGYCNLEGEGWNALLHLAYGDKRAEQGEKCTTKDSNKKENESADATTILQGSFYAGRGLFRSEKDSRGNEFLNLAGPLVYQSLYLYYYTDDDDDDDRNNKEGGVSNNPADVEDRAQDWIHAVTDRMRSSEGISSSTTPEAVFIAVAFIVIFCEVPSSRESASKAMLQALTQSTDVAQLTALIISTIVKPRPGTATPYFAEMKSILDVVLAGRLPKNIVFPLVQAFASTSTTAQEAILASARKRLRRQGDLTFGFSPVIDDTFVLCIYAIGSLIAVPALTEPVVNAWKLLVEILVHNKYSLPLTTRSWFWNLMEEFLKSGRFSQNVAARLFRICLIKLLCIMRKDKLSGRISLCPSSVLAVWISGKATPTEDLTSLFKLLFSLFFSCARNFGTRKRQSIRQWRSLILSCCGPGAEARPPPELDFVDGAVDDDDNQSNTFTYCKLAVCLMLTALDFALSCSAQDTSQGPLLQKIADTIRGLDLQSTKQKLMSQEFNASLFDTSDDTIPEWLLEPTNQDRTHKALPQNAMKCMASSILHSVAGFIRDSRWSAYETDLRSYEERKLILLGLHALSKSALSLDLHSDDVGCIHPGASSSFIQKEIAAFVALIDNSAVVISHCVSANKDFSDTNNILSMTMEQLDDLALLLDNNLTTEQISQRDLWKLFYNIWQLYALVFDERASIRLIFYMEENVATTIENISDSCDSSSAASEREARVREMRGKILDLIKCCLQKFVRAGGSLKSISVTLAHEDFVNPESAGSRSCSEATTGDAVVFWKNCLRKLAGDLSCGLERDSGGVSFDMYETYCDCINMISKLLSNHCRNLSTSMMVEARPIVESEAMLWSGFCRYPPLKRKTMFSKAFVVIGQSLPSLARGIARAQFIQGMAEANNDISDVSGGLPMGNYGIRSFELCTDALKEWISADQESSSPSWVRLTVPDTTDNNSISRHSFRNGGHQGVPAVVTVSVQCIPENPKTNQEAHTPPKTLKLDVVTKEMWCWTCSGALAAIEQVWIDANESVQSPGTDAGKEVHFPLSGVAEDYAGQRIAHLSKVNKTLMLAFVTITTSNTAAGTGQWLVQAFPHDMKSRLCSLIEKMVTTAFASIKVLDAFVQGKSRPKPLCFVEALAVCWVWIAADQYGGFDLATHTRKWYEAEKKRLELTKDSLQRYLAENAVPKRFPRLMFRIEKLESSLCRLHQLLLTENMKHSSSMSRFNLIESFLTAVNVRTVSASDESLKAALERKVQTVNQVLSSTSESVTVKRGNEASVPGKRKRRKKRGGLPPPPVRSRNQTVDKWLRSDQQYGADDDIDDAFLDLEDFIADG